MLKGLKEGKQQIFSEKGKLLQDGQHKNDKRNGVFTIYNDEGVMEMEVTYKDDAVEDKKLNPDLPPFYFSQKIIDESHNENPLPTAPVDENNEKEDVKEESKYKYEKNASEFESNKEILDFLKSDKDIKIKVLAYEYWDGFFQLSNEKKKDNIKHQSINDDCGDEIISITEKDGKQIVSGDGADGYDLKKQTYEDELCIWEEGFCSKDFIISKLNEFIEEDKDNASESIEYLFDYLDMPQDAWEVIELFDAKDGKSGEGREQGLHEFSWHATSYVRSSGVELIFCK